MSWAAGACVTPYGLVDAWFWEVVRGLPGTGWRALPDMKGCIWMEGGFRTELAPEKDTFVWRDWCWYD